MDWYVMALRKYAEFNGRSRRKEYWIYTLVNVIIYAVLYVAGLIMISQGSSTVGIALMGIYCIYGLATLVPSLAVSVRRLHDTNRSGWWLLLGLIPIVGLALIVLLAIDGDPGDNQYGPNPKLGQPAIAA